MQGGLPIVEFADASSFAAWLAGQDVTVTGARLKFAKKEFGASTLSQREAIDCALCEDWIDRQAAPLNACFFLVRFTPRRPRSLWSQVNRTRVLELIAVGRIRPRGLGKMEAARADDRRDRAYLSARIATVPHDRQVALDGCPVAAVRFDALGRGARYAILLGLANTRGPKTRRRRIASLLDAA